MYFEDIPKIVDKKALALEKCKALSNLTAQRKELLELTRETRQKIYNLSLEINSLHDEIEEMVKNESMR